MKKYNHMTISLQQSKNLCFEILTNLMSKYSFQFSFFHSKPITETAFNDSKSTANLQIRDILMLSQDEQCLNRMYYYYNVLGKEQIYQRIRIIGKFYEQNIALSQYPLMILTNTSKIFKTRQRRLKKMIGSNCSSDQSQEQSVKDRSFQSQGFLQSISKPQSSISMQIQQIKGQLNQIIFDDQPYTIYADSPHIYQVASFKIKNCDLQKTLSNLIYDFNDIDIEKTMTDFQRITHLRKNTNTNNFLSVNSLSIAKPVYQSIVVSDTSNNEQKCPITKNTKQTTQQSQSQKYIRKKHPQQKKLPQQKIPPSQYLNHNKLRNFQQYRKYMQNVKYLKVEKPNSNQKNYQDKFKKQMVRQKAMKLLNKVKSQNYINGNNDYNNY